MATKSWRTEDWVAVYLGFFVILATLVLFRTKWVDLAQVAPLFRWTTDGQIASRAASWVPALEGHRPGGPGQGSRRGWRPEPRRSSQALAEGRAPGDREVGRSRSRRPAAATP